MIFNSFLKIKKFSNRFDRFPVSGPTGRITRSKTVQCSTDFIWWIGPERSPVCGWTDPTGRSKPIFKTLVITKCYYKCGTEGVLHLTPHDTPIYLNPLTLILLPQVLNTVSFSLIPSLSHSRFASHSLSILFYFSPQYSFSLSQSLHFSFSVYFSFPFYLILLLKPFFFQLFCSQIIRSALMVEWMVQNNIIINI